MSTTTTTPPGTAYRVIDEDDGHHLGYVCANWSRPASLIFSSIDGDHWTEHHKFIVRDVGGNPGEAARQLFDLYAEIADE